MKTYIRAGSIEYDSAGNELTPQQSSYFKNSVVRDNRGRLLVCYHATYSDFDTFDKSKVGSGSGGSFGSGFYFTIDNEKIIRQCIKEKSNKPFWNFYKSYNDHDIRSIKNKEIFKKILKQFNMEYLFELYKDY